jgi:acetolactate synthase-1/2/3 large subunit
MKRTVAQLVVDTLKEIDVRHVFGVPSGAWLEYMEAIRRTDGISFILTSHESGAAFMATVYGQLTGVPGVCFGTFGPGATNLATGVGCAFLDRAPVIVFTDEMSDDKRHRAVQMNIDHQTLFTPITKLTIRLNPEKVRDDILQAAGIAMSPRPGPVHIGLPLGIASSQTTKEHNIGLTIESQPEPSARLLDEMERLFRLSDKPLLVIGLGAVRAGVREQVLTIAEKFSLPVVLTPMAKGMVPEDHRCYAGVLFHALSDIVGITHQQSDLVISIGYDPVEINYEDWMPQVPLISIDTHAVDIDRNEYEVACEIIGDMVPVLDRLESIDEKTTGWSIDALAKRRTKMFAKMHSKTNTFGPCAALDVLREVLPESGIMTCDVGAHTHLIGQKWPTPRPGKQLMTNGWSAMGFGIPAAVAAKICNPDLPVCAVIGDGGFLMSAGELVVAVREKLQIVFVLFTDNDLSLIRIKQEKREMPSYGTTVRASGTIVGDNIFGVPVLRAHDADTFRSALEQAFHTEGPTIVEAFVEGREYDDLVLRKGKT